MTVDFLLRRAAAGHARALRSPAGRSRGWPPAGSTTTRRRLRPLRHGRRLAGAHFEKMLFDNALLARAYVHAWALTGDTRSSGWPGRPSTSWPAR